METDREIENDRMWIHQGFDASGIITFYTLNDEHFTDEVLQKLIREADSAHPWESYYKSGISAPSIHTIGRAEVMKETKAGGRYYTVKISPSLPLGPQQFGAYYIYLRRLAERLALKETPGISSVGIRVKFDGVSPAARYMTTAGQDRFEKFMASKNATDKK